LAAASEILDVLLSRGLKLENMWEHRVHLQSRTIRQGVKVATVEGVIPAEEVLAHCSRPGRGVPRLNLIEVQRDCVRIIGLGLEEYLILTTSSA
jgi:hypothetical protein